MTGHRHAVSQAIDIYQVASLLEKKGLRDDNHDMMMIMMNVLPVCKKRLFEGSS